MAVRSHQCVSAEDTIIIVMNVIALCLLLLTGAGRVRPSCTSSTFAQAQSREAIWNSSSTSGGGALRTFLFDPPVAFLDDWASADFALISASFSFPAPCNPEISRPDVVIVPQVWIELLPAMSVGIHHQLRGRTGGRVEDMCSLFSNVSLDQVPGCQDWSRMEAWRRLRIFYDTTTPIRMPEASVPKCDLKQQQGSSSSWTVDVSPMIQQWLLERSPWIRSNATLPIIVLMPSRLEGVGVEPGKLHLTYWMDSKLCSILRILLYRSRNSFHPLDSKPELDM